MTLKDAILRSLADINKITNYTEILSNILDRNYYDFKSAKTPGSTVSAILGDFIRNGDTRVKRIKGTGGTYSYYLTKNEENITDGILLGDEVVYPPSKTRLSNYLERDLHILLSSFLKNSGIYSKTIFHEQSISSKDSHQKWIHPDMVGVKFLNLQTRASQNLLKAINRVDTFKVTSYEVKREINTDYDLKKCYFQAVSNSSWANYGYLAAFEISDSLTEEMERLNQSFGIGVIQLRANPFESKILFQSKERELDIKTIDKLCRINKDFESVIDQIEKLLTASEKYVRSTEKELEDLCDKYFSTDSEFEAYCDQKFIPFEKIEFKES